MCLDVHKSCGKNIDGHLGIVKTRHSGVVSHAWSAVWQGAETLPRLQLEEKCTSLSNCDRLNAMIQHGQEVPPGMVTSRMSTVALVTVLLAVL